MRYLYSLLVIYFLGIQVSLAKDSFGPRESRLIFDGSKTSINYRIDNSDKTLPWLVQAWVEDKDEKKTDKFTPVPITFRVEPSSVFTVRVMKTGDLPQDRETLFWAVSNALPGGAPGKQEKEEGKISAKLSLAYRFKVPLFYRPAELKNVMQEPEKIQWSVDNTGQIKVYNPTRFTVQLQNVVVNGKKFQGKGVSYLITPMTGTTLKASASRGSKIQYGVINDHGAVKDYEGTVR